MTILDFNATRDDEDGIGANQNQRHTKLQSDHHHHNTCITTQVFLQAVWRMSFLLPDQQCQAPAAKNTF